MRLLINHQTNYFYGELAQRSVQYIRMTPMPLAHQTIHRWQVMLPKVGALQKDGFGNEWVTLCRNEAPAICRCKPEVRWKLILPQSSFLTTPVCRIACLPSPPTTTCGEAMRAFTQEHLQGF